MGRVECGVVIQKSSFCSSGFPATGVALRKPSVWAESPCKAETPFKPWAGETLTTAHRKAADAKVSTFIKRSIQKQTISSADSECSFAVDEYLHRFVRSQQLHSLNC